MDPTNPFSFPFSLALFPTHTFDNQQSFLVGSNIKSLIAQYQALFVQQPRDEGEIAVAFSSIVININAEINAYTFDTFTNLLHTLLSTRNFENLASDERKEIIQLVYHISCLKMRNPTTETHARYSLFVRTIAELFGINLYESDPAENLLLGLIEILPLFVESAVEYIIEEPGRLEPCIELVSNLFIGFDSSRVSIKQKDEIRKELFQKFQEKIHDAMLQARILMCITGMRPMGNFAFNNIEMSAPTLGSPTLSKKDVTTCVLYLLDHHADEAVTYPFNTFTNLLKTLLYEKSFKSLLPQESKEIIKLLCHIVCLKMRVPSKETETSYSIFIRAIGQLFEINLYKQDPKERLPHDFTERMPLFVESAVEYIIQEPDHSEYLERCIGVISLLFIGYDLSNPRIDRKKIGKKLYQKFQEKIDDGILKTRILMCFTSMTPMIDFALEEILMGSSALNSPSLNHNDIIFCVSRLLDHYSDRASQSECVRLLVPKAIEHVSLQKEYFCSHFLQFFGFCRKLKSFYTEEDYWELYFDTIKNALLLNLKGSSPQFSATQLDRLTVERWISEVNETALFLEQIINKANHEDGKKLNSNYQGYFCWQLITLIRQEEFSQLSHFWSSVERFFLVLDPNYRRSFVKIISGIAIAGNSDDMALSSLDAEKFIESVFEKYNINETWYDLVERTCLDYVHNEHCLSEIMNALSTVINLFASKVIHSSINSSLRSHVLSFKVALKLVSKQLTRKLKSQVVRELLFYAFSEDIFSNNHMTEDDLLKVFQSNAMEFRDSFKVFEHISKQHEWSDDVKDTICYNWLQQAEKTGKIQYTDLCTLLDFVLKTYNSKTRGVDIWTSLRLEACQKILSLECELDFSLLNEYLNADKSESESPEVFLKRYPSKLKSLIDRFVNEISFDESKRLDWANMFDLNSSLYWMEFALKTLKYFGKVMHLQNQKKIKTIDIDGLGIKKFIFQFISYDKGLQFLIGNYKEVLNKAQLQLSREKDRIKANLFNIRLRNIRKMMDELDIEKIEPKT